MAAVQRDNDVYDSTEENGVDDDLMAEVEEAADAARHEIWGEDDRETVMRNYLLHHVKNKNIKFDYRNDKEIMRILKLKGVNLEAQYNYVKSQVREDEDHGLTNIIVDNIANMIYKVSEDTKTRERIQQDEKLRALINKKIGAFDLIPDWFKIGAYIGSYLMTALGNRRAREAQAKNHPLPPASN